MSDPHRPGLMEQVLRRFGAGFEDETLFPPDAGASVRPGDVEVPEGYLDAEKLGQGGMGEVFRVRDGALGRRVALKTVRVKRGRLSDDQLDRFLREARMTAQLQHPGVVAIHALGVLPDGRPYYTMPEIRGDALTDRIEAHHTTGTPGLRALIRVLHRATEPLAHAHAHGVVHRDLKPDNVMIGAHGEVLVLDWGLARRVGGAPDGAVDLTDLEDARSTVTRGMLGTPAYMAPEQIRGQPPTPRTDVYALGGILYEILNGRQPREGLVPHMLDQVLRDAPIEPSLGPLPLADLAHACLSGDPAQRPADAGVVGEVLQTWLDGSERAAEADQHVQNAARLTERAEALRVDASDRLERAKGVLAALGAYAPVAEKAVGWALEDEGRAALREADRLHHEAELALWTALSRDDTHLAARRALADHFRVAHAEAERRRDAEAEARTRVALEAQLDALPSGVARPYRAYLKGLGAISLDTSPSGAEVVARPIVEHERRRVEGEARRLGTTPLRDVPLEAGSWMLELRHPDCEPVRYPVSLGREGRWDATPPGASGPAPVRLPPRGAVGPDERYVAAGWFTAGGDPDAPRGLPERRFWCPGFVMKAALVTNAEYLEFLDAVVARGQPELARRWSPRDYHAEREEATPLWGQREDGSWFIAPDADGDLWEPDWPVMMIDVPSAFAYAAWRAEVDGLPWRFPAELEWEKAARGVDRRIYPWGDHLDPTWAAIEYHDGVSVVSAAARPVDCSPYGVLQMGGCLAEYCIEGRDAPEPRGPWVEIPPMALYDGGHAARGGGWSGSLAGVRCATRGFAPTYRGLFTQGFRLARSFP